MSNEFSNTVFLTVRASSTRLPRKCFLPFGNYDVLGHVIARAQHFKLKPILCTSNENSDDEIESYAMSNGILCFRGSLGNKILRWYKCAKTFKVDAFHTVDVDDPFFDPKQVLKSLKLLKGKNLDVVFPTSISSSGGASVGYSISTSYLESNLNKFDLISEIEMVDTFFNDDLLLRQEILESDNDEIENVRLTLDYEEDYWLLLFILKLCGPFAERANIKRVFENNPELYRLNWDRNIEWQNNQELIRAKFDLANPTIK